MYLPFFPLADTHAVLEEAEQCDQQLSEIEAELGSSYFCGGASSWDATAMAHMDRLEREAEFAATPEGERYFARLEAARFMDSALNGLRLSSEEEVADYRIFTPVGGTVIPEFTGKWGVPYLRTDIFTPDPDDIPF